MSKSKVPLSTSVGSGTAICGFQESRLHWLKGRTRVPENSDKQSEIEYRLLQEHAQFLMEQRTRVFDLYVKIILIPAAFISYLSVVVPTGPNASTKSEVPQVVDGAAYSLLAVSLTALCLYIYYCLETVNSASYFSDIQVIRDHLRARLGVKFKQDSSKARYLNATRNYVPFFRGMAFASLNSLIASLAVYLIFSNLVLGIVLYFLLIVMHWGIYAALSPSVYPTRLFKQLYKLLKLRTGRS